LQFIHSVYKHKYMLETMGQNGRVLFTANQGIFGASSLKEVLSLTERQMKSYSLSSQL